MSKKTYAVVTGIGLATPIGVTHTQIITHLRESRGVAPHTFDFLAPGISQTKAFRVFPNDRIPQTNERDPYIDYGLYSVQEALRDSALDAGALSDGATGVVVSSSKGGVRTLHAGIEEMRVHHRLEDPVTFFSNAGPECLSLQIAKAYQIQGPVKSVVTACATGTHSIIAGARMIEDGDVDVCIVGASDASIDPLMIAGYTRMGVYGSEAIRPFDKRRNGFFIGEGAGILVLESAEHAQQRGARVYAKIEAYIEGQETHNALRYDKNNNALAVLLGRLLATIGTTTIDYVNAHATGTQAGDAYESDQLAKAFGPIAADIPISSTKGFTGHLLGASGAVEAAFSVLCLANGIVPATLNFEFPDEGCILDYVSKSARHKELHRVLSLSMGFGGHIGIISMTKV